MTTRPEQDDDQAWLDLLAGRSVDEVTAPTRVEAAWLRAALLAWRAEAPPEPPPEPAARAARLLERARAAGLLAPVHADAGPTLRGSAGWHDRPASGWRLSAAGVALGLVIAVAVPLWTLPEAPLPVERGGALQTLRANDPTRRRDALADMLRDAGLAATSYQRLGRPGLDVELPSRLTEPQRQVLREAGLIPPDGPGMRVEFVAEGARP